VPPEDGWQVNNGAPPAPRLRFVGDGAGGAAAKSYEGEGYCNGIFTDMHMTGFQWHSEDIPCLIYLIPGFTLTNDWKFLAAAIVTIAASVGAEYLVAVRRRLGPGNFRPIRATAGARAKMLNVAQRAKHLGLYCASRALGYLVMLVTMTYSVELFLAVLAGLTLGHALFNLDAPAGEDMTACCQANAGQQLRLAGQAKPRLRAFVEVEEVHSSLSSGKHQPTKHLAIQVEGMVCNACVNTVKNSLLAIDTVHQVGEVQLDTGICEFQVVEPLRPETSVDVLRGIYNAVEEVGFGVRGVQLLAGISGSTTLLGTGS